MKNLLKLVFAFQGLFLLQTPLYADDSLRNILENSMLKVRQAIIEDDMEAFLSSIDPLNPNAQITPENWKKVINNDHARTLLLRGVPGLKVESKFLKIQVEGAWAGYYAEGELDDVNYQSLRVYLFHKSDVGWRPAGKSNGLIKAKPGGKRALQGFPTWKGQAEMMRTIEENPDFQIKNLIKEMNLDNE